MRGRGELLASEIVEHRTFKLVLDFIDAKLNGYGDSVGDGLLDTCRELVFTNDANADSPKTGKIRYHLVDFETFLESLTGDQSAVGADRLHFASSNCSLEILNTGPNPRKKFLRTVLMIGTETVIRVALEKYGGLPLADSFLVFLEKVMNHQPVTGVLFSHGGTVEFVPTNRPGPEVLDKKRYATEQL